MKTNPACARVRKTVSDITKGRRTTSASLNKPIAAFSDATIHTSAPSFPNSNSTSPSAISTNPFTSANPAAPTVRRLRRPSPTIAGSPIRRHRGNGSSTSNSNGPSQGSTILSNAHINHPPGVHVPNNANTTLSLRRAGPRPPPLVFGMQFAINATAILNDRDDPRLLEDMTKVYTENNEDWSPTEDLILPPVTLPGATSRRVRRFATATHQNPVHLQLIQDTKAKLSMGQYHDLSNEYLDSLIIALEEIQDYNNDVDVEFSAGVMSLTYPPNGVYVINKQPVNKQIWLSSPISGPFRFDYREVEANDSAGNPIRVGKWVDHRQGTSLTALLQKELEEALPLECEDRVWDEEKQEWD